jgi:hypothetical protein
MRILGWLLLVGGVLLCLSILWAAPGFLCMGLGLIFLQIAEHKRRRAKSAASPSDQSEPQVEPAAIPQAARVFVPRKADDDAEPAPESAAVLHSYDTQKWRALLSSDADISRLAKALEPYGQKYLDEFAAAYLALNDKDYLPVILRKIIASAARDSGQNVPGGCPDKNINADAVGIAFNRTRAIDREMRPGYSEKLASVDNASKIDAGPQTERVSKPSPGNFSGHVDVSAAGKMAAAEETNLQPDVTDADSGVSTARAAEARNPAPPAVTDAALGPGEKKHTREADAVDADNLTKILHRLSQALPPKPSSDGNEIPPPFPSQTTHTER